MTDAVALKETVDELTKAKAENVSLVGRLEGFEKEYEKLGALFDQAKLENETLRRKLDGKINELGQEPKNDGFIFEPGNEERKKSDLLSPGSDESFVAVKEEDGTETDADVFVEGATGEGSWQPIFTTSLPKSSNQRRLSGSPPRTPPALSELQQMIGDVVSAVSDGREPEHVIRRLTKLSDRLAEYEEAHQKDRRYIEELEEKSAERKNLVHELQLEVFALRHNNSMLTRQQSAETQTKPISPKSPSDCTRLEARLAAVSADREQLYHQLTEVVQEGRRECREAQARADQSQQELNLQIRTNQALQTRVSELEDERWKLQRESNDLKREHDRLREGRRLGFETLAPQPSVAVEQELQAAHCQLEAYKEDFENERKDRERAAKEKDDLSEKLREVLQQFETFKHSSEKRERILKRKLDIGQKENRDLLRIIDEYDQKAALAIHNKGAPSDHAKQSGNHGNQVGNHGNKVGNYGNQSGYLGNQTRMTNVENWVVGNYPIDVRARGSAGPSAPSAPILRPPMPNTEAPAERAKEEPTPLTVRLPPAEQKKDYRGFKNALWKCPQCTFNNPMSERLCQMCYNPNSDPDRATVFEEVPVRELINLKDQK